MARACAASWATSRRLESGVGASSAAAIAAAVPSPRRFRQREESGGSWAQWGNLCGMIGPNKTGRNCNKDQSHSLTLSLRTESGDPIAPEVGRHPLVLE